MIDIRVLLIEDDIFIADGTSRSLKKSGVGHMLVAHNFAEAIEILSQGEIDIALVDIDLNGYKTGLEIGAYAKNKNIPFIYLTSHSNDETIEKAANTSPNAFLSKPYRIEDVVAAIKIHGRNNGKDLLEHKRTNSKKFLFVKDCGVLKKIIIDEITYIQAENVYVNIYTSQKKYLVRAYISEIISNVGNKNFVQVHRSYIVNVAHIKNIRHNMANIDGIQIPISKTYKKDLLNAINAI